MALLTWQEVRCGLGLWDLALRRLRTFWPVQGVGRVKPYLAYALDGSVLLAAMDSQLIAWDVSSGRELSRITPGPVGVGPLAISPDGRLVATGTSDGGIRLWPLELLLGQGNGQE